MTQMNLEDLGYYKVGTEIFLEKVPAMLRAQQLKVNMEWIFNDTVFRAINWTIEPTTTLDEFYKIRAKQIREEFDYILMFCSGGADSTNMFHAFVNNGLHIDEVVGSAPISGLRDWKNPDPTECKYDPGGYFIVKGNEKVILSLERMIFNKPLVFVKKEGTRKQRKI